MSSLKDQIDHLERRKQHLRAQHVKPPEVQTGYLLDPTRVHVTLDPPRCEPHDIAEKLKHLTAAVASTKEYNVAEIRGPIHFTTAHGTVKDDGHITVVLSNDPANLATEQTIHIYLKHSSGRRLLPKKHRPPNYKGNDLEYAKYPKFANHATPRSERIARETQARREAQERNHQIEHELREIEAELERLHRLLRAEHDHKRHDKRDDDDDDDDDHHGHGGHGMRIKGIASRDQGLQIKGRAAADQGLRIRGMAQHHGQRRTKK